MSRESASAAMDHAPEVSEMTAANMKAFTPAIILHMRGLAGTGGPSDHSLHVCSITECPGLMLGQNVDATTFEQFRDCTIVASGGLYISNAPSTTTFTR